MHDGAASWKRYPHVPDWGDPHWFTFPACDGDARALGMQTYFVDGFLRGGSTGRSYAFLVVFTDARILGRTLRFSFYTLALFDCDRGHYGTYTDFDWPDPSAPDAPRKLATAPGHLALAYAAPAGASTWHNALDARGGLRPFAWELRLHGVDHRGARMSVTLDVDAQRPPAPLGGRELAGEMMFLGAERTYSYFQSGLRMRGRLAWGDVEEDVEGDVGWIDRQWAEDDFSKHQDAESTRYRNEWRVMQFDNGWDVSCFHQYQREHRNAVVPWTGVSAQGPAPGFEVRATHRVELTTPDFVRSPGVVRSLAMLSEGPRWFPHRYRLRVPEWEMDVEAEPIVDAPAHQLPIEWWSGPVRLRGTLFGAPVTGLGFDERSCPRVRGWELAQAIAIVADHADGAGCRLLAYRAWEVEALALRGDAAAAAQHLAATVDPLIAALPAPLRGRLDAIARDLRDVLATER